MKYLVGLPKWLAERGVSSLVLDQPGTGEALRLQGLHARYDSVHWASRVVDWLEDHPEVDSKRIGMEGVSLGGYYCPRAVANEPRLALGVCWGANYAERLGFITTDRFSNVGPFMRPAGTDDHHTLFFLNTPPHMKGIERFTFHMSGPTEVVRAGNRMVEKGYQSFWGPGRHIFGSNWFWYFKSPFGCNMEFDADMDLHDDEWNAREALPDVDNSQAFLLQYREKWAPMGPPPGVPSDWYSRRI